MVFEIKNKVDTIEEIENEIKNAGLFPFSEDKLKEFPLSLHKYCGMGIGIWQYPIQFSKYLHFVTNLGFPISSYIEIGCAAGGTFTFTSEFLGKKNPVYCVGIDPAGPGCTLNGGKNMYTEAFCEYIQIKDHTFITAKSTDLYKHIPINTTFDLVLIDGDHSYEGVKEDFDMIDGKARIIVLHDIVNSMCPGVCKFWNELRDTRQNDYMFEEFTEQYGLKDSFLGIGVLISKNY